ncbi:hypothetical protein ACWGM0_09120 [Sphingomonas bisphenolicum]
MVSAINATGIGNAWGQIKKSLDPVVQTVTLPAPSTTPTPTPAPTPTASPPPVASAPPTVIASPAPSEPLTYSAPSSGPRQVTAAAADPTPTAGLSDRLSDAGYYASPEAAAVADPAATAQTATDGASLTQAQLIAQAAYAIVARAGTDNRMSLIQDG